MWIQGSIGTYPHEFNSLISAFFLGCGAFFWDVVPMESRSLLPGQARVGVLGALVGVLVGALLGSGLDALFLLDLFFSRRLRRRLRILAHVFSSYRSHQTLSS